MTTTTAATWPTVAELDHASKLVAEAHNALDELHLACYQLESALDGEDPTKSVPTLEQFGAVSRFIEWADQDIEGMRELLGTVRRLQHVAATSMAD